MVLSQNDIERATCRMSKYESTSNRTEDQVQYFRSAHTYSPPKIIDCNFDYLHKLICSTCEKGRTIQRYVDRDAYSRVLSRQVVQCVTLRNFVHLPLAACIPGGFDSSCINTIAVVHLHLSAAAKPRPQIRRL